VDTFPSGVFVVNSDGTSDFMLAGMASVADLVDLYHGFNLFLVSLFTYISRFRRWPPCVLM
jgi:hypothetical protein